jgi:hypothetical protein
MKNINRREFMRYFRSQKFDQELTVDDRLEIFVHVLAYIPDNFIDIINEILSDYSAEFRVKKKKKE